MAKRGEYGSNMIRVTVRFWTNHVQTQDKKVASEAGVAYLNANKHRGIKPHMERFDTLTKMPDAVKAVLKKGGIKLKYYSKNYVPL